MRDLPGRTAFVTGAASGIGLAMARSGLRAALADAGTAQAATP